MGVLRKIGRAIEKALGYLEQLDGLVAHGNERLDAYQAKLADAVTSLQGNIDAIQATDIVALRSEIQILRDELAALRVLLQETDEG